MNCKILASDIFDFAELLVSHDIVQDAKSLYDAAAKLQCSQNVSEWMYECSNIKFSVEGAFAGTIPHKVGLVDIIFNITLKGTFQTTENKYLNPLAQLSFDIELEGLRDFDDKIDTFYACWHLDKHIPGTGTPTYVHPEYHLTFGGNRLEEKGVDNFGSTLILPAPRIAYPPMDAILGIDFILQNYYPLSTIANLINDSKYKEIIGNAQDRLWKPYYLSLSAAWDISTSSSFEQGFEHFNLNPHLN